MLVPSMNPLEITTEVYTDFSKLYETTANRLAGEYDRERKKLKIDKARAYTKIYPVKTHAKNPWLLSVRKAPAVDRYKDEDSIHVGYTTYYYNKNGLTVFSITPSGPLNVYYGHFFKRYNERMKRNLSSPLDVVKSYFTYNGYAGFSIVKKNNKEHTIGFAPDGILLGELQHDRLWLVNKTFVSRDLSRNDQDEEEKRLIALFKNEIDKSMQLPKVDGPNHNSNLSVVKALEGALRD